MSLDFTLPTDWLRDDLLRMTFRVRRLGAPDVDVRDADVLNLVHITTRFRMAWRSLCGHTFMSYETTQETDRVPTCVWCVVGAVHYTRSGFETP